MTMFTKTSRAIATAAAAAIALSTIGLQPAAAGGRYHNGGDAAAAAAIIGIFGTVAALIAADQYRNHHRHGYYGPVYGGPVYGGPDRGAPGYYWRRHQHW